MRIWRKLIIVKVITMGRMSDRRRARRILLTRAKKGRLRKGETESYFADNKGVEYPYKWAAKLSSFYNVVMGCFKNGFPIVAPKLWYTAWAFYPFFFIRKDLKVEDPIPVLNHERIHVRQQRDIHLTISLPLIILCGFAELFGWFNTIYLLCSVPFIPTILYGFEMLRSFHNLWKRNNSQEMVEKLDSPITFNKVRENTCFERESISRAPNADYLLHRKFWAVLAYTGWKRFQNYGVK